MFLPEIVFSLITAGTTKIDPERFKKSASLGECFLIFCRRIRIGDDACPDWKISHAGFADRGSYDDAQLGLAVEPEVTQCAGVRTARGRLELINDFHRPKLW